MNSGEFVVLVAEMRKAQNLYYKTRLKGELIRCKDLESRVDKALREGVSIETGGVSETVFRQKQLDLFGNPLPTDGQGENEQ